jgi:hypothetical protein
MANAFSDVLNRYSGKTLNKYEPDDGLFDMAPTVAGDAKRYWVDEPQEVGYRAFQGAHDRYGSPMQEWTKADAAKHMAWQNELAKRTMLPQPIGGAIANGIGLAKEVLMDGVGSIGNWATGKGGDPRNTIKNSFMDLRNNAHGAFSLPMDGDSAENAINAAGNSTGNALSSLYHGRPYSRE